MDLDEMLSLLALGSVLPYVATAAVELLGKLKTRLPGADAPV